MTETEKEINQVSAGEQLKHLREIKNFSVLDIASRLNLDARIIEAIENNNFDQLPAATYARGYLRSYSKILGIDPETIMASYNADAPEPPEIIPEVKHPTQTSSSNKPVRAFTYLISLTLAILLIAWLYSNFIVDKTEVVEVVSAESFTALSDDLPYSYPVLKHAASVENPDLEVSVEEFPVPDPLDLTNLEEVTAASDDAIETEDEGDLEITPVETIVDEGPDSIRLRLASDSWIEIVDSIPKRKYVGLGREGQVINLKGTAPFSVLLGFANGVSLEYNGQPFNIAPYTSGTIARFKLGQ